jgi:hypothetical protein
MLVAVVQVVVQVGIKVPEQEQRKLNLLLQGHQLQEFHLVQMAQLEPAKEMGVMITGQVVEVAGQRVPVPRQQQMEYWLAG